MDWLNPVEWFAWIYGKFFQNHVVVGGAAMTMLFAAIGIVLWIRGVDKYKEEHPLKIEAGQTDPKQEATPIPEIKAHEVVAQSSAPVDPMTAKPKRSIRARGSSPQVLPTQAAIKQPATARDTIDFGGGNMSGMQAALVVDPDPQRGVDINVKGGTFNNNGAVVQNFQGLNARIKVEDITANGNKAVVQNGPQQSPPMTQECAPGASCAQTSGQSGGIAALTQTGTNNIAQVGNNNQVLITAKPMVRSMVVALQMLCDIRLGHHLPESTVTLTMTTGSAASFTGLGRAAALAPRGPRIVEPWKGSDSVAILKEWFTYDETQGLIGANIEDLEKITTVSVDPAWDGGAWCSRVENSRITIFVNEQSVFDSQIRERTDVPEKATLPNGTEVPGWPSIVDFPVKFDPTVLRQIK